jgi:hypothetical protein
MSFEIENNAVDRRTGLKKPRRAGLALPAKKLELNDFTNLTTALRNSAQGRFCF